jgi:hypothetical protein
MLMLINERKNGNQTYHSLGRTKISFWEEVAGKINQRFRTNYNAYQCRKKFDDLIQEYKVRFLYYIRSFYVIYSRISIKNYFLLENEKISRRRTEY